MSSSLLSALAVIGLVGVLLLMFGQRAGQMDRVVDQAAAAAVTTASARPQAPIQVAPVTAMPNPATHQPTAMPTGEATHRPTAVAVPAPTAVAVPAPTVRATPSARLPVLVLDESGRPDLVTAFRTALRARGWVVPRTGHWVGTIPLTTVYYPVGMEAQAAELMADFPSITRSRPAFPGIPDDRLTVIICTGFRPS